MTHERFSSPFAFDMALADPVFAMVHRGIRIDMERREEMFAHYMQRWEKCQLDLGKLSGRNLNVNSQQQVIEWLFEDLGLPPRFKNKKVSTEESKLRAVLADCLAKEKTMTQYQAKERWVVGALSIIIILRIRGIRKRLSSYLGMDKELELSTTMVDPDGRMRQQLRIGGTENGRFSSSKTCWNTGCNMQTIPREMRILFIASDGKVICEHDLNRGESWIYAHLSEDPEMLRIHLEGGDFHSETASVISSVFADPLSVDEIIMHKHGKHYKVRYMGKRVNHASAYRMGEFKQAEVINEEAEETGITITVSQARKAQALWKQKYFMMPAWWNRIETELNKTRKLVTPYGRERIFYSHWGAELFKEATAWTPSATSVDYINLGMLDVWNDLDQKGALDLLHQNHDSILFECNESDLPELMGEVQQRLERKLVVGKHQFTIPVEGSSGPSWGEQTEWHES